MPGHGLMGASEDLGGVGMHGLEYNAKNRMGVATEIETEGGEGRGGSYGGRVC
jgi:hypothetical protein